ncbi:hypothetical protein ACTHPH_16995 [Paenibacillus pasadenensis]|nr:MULTISPECIES: hypothetical protein [Paenibacillus]QGG55382.1 hypothetical protein GE073_07300 [Paenibacillus sp. B01]
MSMETGMEAIQIGDWVSGVTVMDERFIGYVDAADPVGFYRIVVTQSDRERIVGKRVGARASKVRKLSEHGQQAGAGELRTLIELALLTWDEDWFRELTERARTADAEPGKSGSNGMPVNRISSIL